MNPLVIIDAESYLYDDSILTTKNSGVLVSKSIIKVLSIVRHAVASHPNSEIVVVICKDHINTRASYLSDLFFDKRSVSDTFINYDMDFLRTVIDGMGIPLIEEADHTSQNIIYTIANETEDIQKIIYSCDLSLAQLIDKNTSLIEPYSATALNNDSIKDKIGISPHQIPDFLSMTGSRLRGIPMSPRITPKIAVDWLVTYGDIEGIAAAKNYIGGRAIDELILDKDIIIKYKDELTCKKEDSYSKLHKKIERSNIKPGVLYPKLINNGLEEWLPTDIQSDINSLRVKESRVFSLLCIEDRVSMTDLIRKLSSLRSFSISISENKNSELTGIGISYNEGHAYYIGIKKSGAGIDPEFIYDSLKNILENKDIKKVSHNSKALYGHLYKKGIELNGLASDLETLIYAIDTSNNRMDINKIYNKFSEDDQEISSNSPELKDESHTGLNAIKSWNLNRILYKKASQLGYPRVIYENYELPLIKILSKMECEGICLSKELITTQREYIDKKIDKINSELSIYFGDKFEVGSTSDIADLIYNKLGLSVIKKTKSGLPSTDEETLYELSKQHAAPGLIIKYRSLSKLRSTYTDKLIEKINNETKKIHTTFNQAIASTGRLSSSEPNLQNIPVRTEEGRRIRSAFLASNGNYLLSADYSQIELRILAHLSKDEKLISAFNSGRDIHAATASEIFNIPEENLTKEQRSSAKAINFGLIYGMSAYGLSKKLSISKDKAESYISLYFSRYPGVINYLNHTKKSAKENGYVETLSGRRIFIKNINSQNYSERSAAERVAINAPMQASSSDIIKKAMIDIDSWLNKSSMKSKMILQVHDELIFDCPPNEVRELARVVSSLMSRAFDLIVPLSVGIEIGKNLGESMSIDANDAENTHDVGR